MPIYEYICTSCGHEFEILQGIKEAQLSDCPACRESKLQKKLSAAAFHLKGTGWYETDFKNSGKPKDDSSKSDKTSSKSTKESKQPDAEATKDKKEKPSVAKSDTGSTASAS